jgi:hypothetical protein
MKNIALSFPIQLRAIALVTAIALLAWAFGLPVWVQNANAANVITFSDTLSDSDRGVPATHTLSFTTVNDMNSDEIFRVYFDEELTGLGTTFNLTGLTPGDITGTGFSATCGSGDGIEYTVGSNHIEGTVCTGETVPAGAITIVVGGANEITNPDPGVGVPTSYVISLQGAGLTPITDSGDTRIAIIDDVTVTADVDTIFNFTITGVTIGTTVNNEAETTSTTSSATSIPFGTIAPGTAKVVAQELTVDTNALNGFSVSVFADQTLTSENGATIDPFVDNTAVATPEAWAGPAERSASGLMVCLRLHYGS